MNLYRKRYTPLLLFFLFLFLALNTAGTAMAAPQISPIDNQTGKEDTAITVSFTINGNQSNFPFPLPGISDPDDPVPVTVTVTASNHSLIPDSGIIHSSSGTDHQLVITPASNKSGETAIIITADDGDYSAMETFTLTVTAVNDPPLITVPDAQQTDEDTDLVFSSEEENAIRVSDVDAGDNAVKTTLTAEHGILKISSENSNISGNNSGSLVLNGSISQINAYLDGLIYSPEPGRNGEDTLKIVMDDKGHSGENGGFIFPIFGNPSTDTKSIAITIAAVNDPLSLHLPEAAQETREDTALLFSEDSGNALSVTDDDGISGDFEVEMLAENGTVSVPEGSGLITEEGAEEGSLLLRGALSVINTALAGLRYEPNPDWNGEDTLHIRAGELESSDSESGEILIQVSSVNDAPVLDSSAEITLDAIAMNAENPAGNSVEEILENRITDADEGDDAGIAVIAADNTKGTWEYSEDGGSSWSAFAADIAEENALLLSAAAIIRFVPAADWTGKSAVSFRAWDRSDNAETGSRADTGENGGAAAFSAETAEASVSVTDIPEPPGISVQADAGEDQEVTEGDTVTLDGSGSAYPADAVIVYIWTADDNSAGIALSDAHAVKPVFTAPEVGAEGMELHFTLTLRDETENSYTDTTVVRVKDNDSPDLIRAEAGQDQNVYEGETVTLNASASYIPAGISPLYAWEKTAGPAVTLSNPNAAVTTFIAPDVESGNEVSLTFKLTVRDNCCQEDDDTLNIRVLKPSANQNPVAKAGSDQNVKKGDTVILNASESYDPDGSLVTYHWRESSSSGVVLSSPDQPQTSFTAPSGGSSGKNLTFVLTVSDNTGAQAEDSITVNVSPDTVPVQQPGQPAGNTVTEGGTVIMKGSELGDYGADVVYSWKQISGPEVELSDSHAADPTFVAPAVGAEGADLLFELIITTSGEQVYKSNVNVHVADNGIVIPDAPENVLPFHPAEGVDMAVVISGNGKLILLEPVDSALITDNRNRPESLIYGMFRMHIKTDEPAETVTADIYMKDAAADGYRWYKYNETEGWIDFSSHSLISADRKKISLTLTDGGAGDSDGTADGIIRDPSGLGIPNDGSNPGNGGEPSGGGAGDDGGGCFIRSLFF